MNDYDNFETIQNKSYEHNFGSDLSFTINYCVYKEKGLIEQKLTLTYANYICIQVIIRKAGGRVFNVCVTLNGKSILVVISKRLSNYNNARRFSRRKKYNLYP